MMQIKINRNENVKINQSFYGITRSVDYKGFYS